jgi:hypothetical protein
MNGIHEVTGSTPVWSITLSRYFPVTWVTDYTEHIGNTFGPNGFSIGSSRHASSSK